MSQADVRKKVGTPQLRKVPKLFMGEKKLLAITMVQRTIWALPMAIDTSAYPFCLGWLPRRFDNGCAANFSCARE